MNIKYVLFTGTNRNIDHIKAKIPEIFIYNDNEKISHKNAAAKALKYAYDDINDYYVILEDDVLILDNFKKDIEIILTNNTSKEIISLMHISNEYLKAYTNGYRWVKMKTTSWFQGTIIPKQHIIPLINFYNEIPYIKWACVGLSMYCLIYGLSIYMPLPNIIQHNDYKNKKLGNKQRISPIWDELPDNNYKMDNYFIGCTNRSLKQYNNAYKPKY
jgi:GR25 family glycosyltransferase involved in LPS biosynthesis